MTPSVWDLHLHHVVWVSPGGGPTFASGEEKTIVKMPQGYGAKVGGDEYWGLNYMIHSLNPRGGRQVYITWEIDWVPETTPARTDINPTRVQWLDVAGAPQLYPGLRRRARLRHQRRRQVRLPRRGPDRSQRARVRGALEHQPQPQVGRAGRRAGRWSSAPGICTRAGSTSTSRSRATAPTRGRSTATTRRRSRQLFRSEREVLRARRRGQLGRQHGGDAARVADQPQGRRHRLDQHDL